MIRRESVVKRAALDPWCCSLGLVRLLLGWDVLEVLWDGTGQGWSPACPSPLKDRAGMATPAGAPALGDGNHSHGGERGSVLLSPPVLGWCEGEQMLTQTLPAGIEL